MKNVVVILIVMIGLFGRNALGSSIYEVVDLSPLTGKWSIAYDINDSGQVVGAVKANTKMRAFLYKKGEMIDIGKLTPGSTSAAYSISNSGQVVGFSSNGYASSNRGFSYSEGTVKSFPNRSLAFGVNDSGAIVGVNDWGRPSYYENGGMKSFTTQSHLSYAYGVNNSDEIVGIKSGRPFLYRNNAFEKIGLLNSPGAAYDISDSGHIVGELDKKAFVYKNGALEYVGLPFENRSISYGVNDSGDTVGTSKRDGWSAFLYSDGKSYDLNDLTPFSNYELGEARAINESGQIAANGHYGGKTRALLLNPIAEFPDGSKMLNAPGFEIPDLGGQKTEWGKLELLNEFDSSRATVVVVHGWNTDENRRELPGWVNNMGDALDGRDVNVLAWNWQEVAYDTPPFPNNAQDFVPGEAVNLSRELAQKLGGDYGGKIHLIGHSLGSGIATRTAIYMQDDFDVKRLTLLDGPSGNIEKALDSDVYLERLLGQIESNTYIENYVSRFGSYYTGNNVVNYGLLNQFEFPSGDTSEDSHSWVHKWYTNTIKANLEYGYSKAEAELGDFDNPWIQNDQFGFKKDEGFFDGDHNTAHAYHYPSKSLGSANGGTETIISQSDLNFNSIGTAWEYDGTYYGLTNSPVYIMTELTIPVGESYLSFDLGIIEPHEGDMFELWVNDFLLFSICTDAFEAGEWESLYDFNLSKWADQDALVSFGLIAEMDGVHSQFGIRDVNIYRSGGEPVPLPASVLLFGTGLIGIFGASRKKNK